jgi:hypothetical protein
MGFDGKDGEALPVLLKLPIYIFEQNEGLGFDFQALHHKSMIANSTPTLFFGGTKDFGDQVFTTFKVLKGSLITVSLDFQTFPKKDIEEFYSTLSSGDRLVADHDTAIDINRKLISMVAVNGQMSYLQKDGYSSAGLEDIQLPIIKSEDDLVNVDLSKLPLIGAGVYLYANDAYRKYVDSLED